MIEVHIVNEASTERLVVVPVARLKTIRVQRGAGVPDPTKSMCVGLEEVHQLIDALKLAEHMVVEENRRGPWVDPLPVFDEKIPKEGA